LRCGRSTVRPFHRITAQEVLLYEHPVGRLVTPAEVASALAFLGSPAAGYMNGVNLAAAAFTAAMTTDQVDFSGLA
jgi:NAD(P)-dependent dehydrogenase (short-subunit alcohol dehydrogenase family)